MYDNVGLNAGIPKQSAAMAAILGATGGFMLAYQSSSGATPFAQGMFSWERLSTFVQNRGAHIFSMHCRAYDGLFTE
jgi:hypothetical protein